MSDQDFGDQLSELIDAQLGITTGWLLVRAVTDVEHLENITTGYRYTTPAGQPIQPIHCTRGPVDMAHTKYDRICRGRPVIDLQRPEVVEAGARVLYIEERCRACGTDTIAGAVARFWDEVRQTPRGREHFEPYVEQWRRLATLLQPELERLAGDFTPQVAELRPPSGE